MLNKKHRPIYNNVDLFWEKCLFCSMATCMCLCILIMNMQGSFGIAILKWDEDMCMYMCNFICYYSTHLWWYCKVGSIEIQYDRLNSACMYCLYTSDGYRILEPMNSKRVQCSMQHCRYCTVVYACSDLGSLQKSEKSLIYKPSCICYVYKHISVNIISYATIWMCQSWPQSIDQRGLQVHVYMDMLIIQWNLVIKRSDITKPCYNKVSLLVPALCIS